MAGCQCILQKNLPVETQGIRLSPVPLPSPVVVVLVAVCVLRGAAAYCVVVAAGRPENDSEPTPGGCSDT